MTVDTAWSNQPTSGIDIVWARGEVASEGDNPPAGDTYIRLEEICRGRDACVAYNEVERFQSGHLLE